MNSLKKGEGVPLLNFEGGPGVPLLNFEGGSGVPLLNFKGVPGPGSQGPEILVPILHHAYYNVPWCCDFFAGLFAVKVNAGLWLAQMGFDLIIKTIKILKQRRIQNPVKHLRSRFLQK